MKLKLIYETNERNINYVERIKNGRMFIITVSAAVGRQGNTNFLPKNH